MIYVTLDHLTRALELWGHSNYGDTRQRAELLYKILQTTSRLFPESTSISSREIVEALKTRALVAESGQPMKATELDWEFLKEVKEVKHLTGAEAAHLLEEFHLNPGYPSHWVGDDHRKEPPPAPRKDDWRNWRGTILRRNLMRRTEGVDCRSDTIAYRNRIVKQLERYAHLRLYLGDVLTWTEIQAREAEAWTDAMRGYWEDPEGPRLRAPRPPIHLMAQPLMRSVNWDDQEG